MVVDQVQVHVHHQLYLLQGQGFRIEGVNGPSLIKNCPRGIRPARIKGGTPFWGRGEARNLVLADEVARN